MANYSTLISQITTAISTNGQNLITGASLQAVLLQMVSELGQAGYIFGGVVNPGDSPASSDSNLFYVAASAGTYTNFNGLTVSGGELAIFTYSGGSWGKNSVTSAATPVVNDLTTGGATSALSAEMGKQIGENISQLGQQVVYDVTMNNPTAGPNNDGKFESLSALLSDANLSTLIPVAVRCGGMSIRFVHTSDNKYMQWRYMGTSIADADFTNVANWQSMNVDAEPTAGSNNLVKSGGVAQSLADIYQTNIIQSKNLLNINTVNDSKYVNDNGNLSNNANYKASDYIPVVEGETYTFQTGSYYANSRTKRTINQIAGYDENKTFVSGSYATYGNSYVVPTRVKFIRFSVDAVYLSVGNLPSFVKGTTVTDYFDYSENITIRTLRKNIIPQNIKNGVVFKFDINNDDFESDIEFQHMCAYCITFHALIDTFNEIRIGKGYQSYMGATLGIDNTDIYVYEGANTTPIVTEPHGLTFKDYIGLAITTEYGNVATLKLYTNGGTYTKQYFAWDARKGTFFVKSIGTNVLNVCTFGYYCYALEKPTWIYGDSYLTNAAGVTDRWTSYLIAGKHTNYLLNGYPGRGSAEAILSLKTDLNYGTPQRIIWCLGMNNGDNGTINAEWKSAVDELMEICRNNRIELILAALPSTPSVVNSYKNGYVRKFDYRWIDFVRAVNLPDGNNNWYDDMLSNDNVHPAIQGAIALYQQAVCDVPELIS